MSETIKDRKLEILIGLFLLGGIIAWLVIPISWQDTTIILEGGGGGAPVSCLPSGGLVLAQNLTDLCDVTIISPTTNQLIEYNGSQWVNVDSAFITTNATCANLGNEISSVSAYVCADDTNNILSFKNIVRGDGIGIDFNGTSIIVQNNTPESSLCYNATALSSAFEMCEFAGELQLDGIIYIKLLDNGTGIEITDNGEILTVTNSLPEATTASNLGSSSSLSEGVFASEVLNDLQFKRLLEGTSITLSSNSTHITITNSAPESTNCSNVGTGNFILKTTVIDCTANSLIAGTGITIANTTDDYTFSSQCANTGTGEAVCESSNNINSLIAGDSISITDTTGDLTITNTGAIKLCEVTAVGGETSLSCSLSTAPQTIAIGIYHNSSVTNTVWEVRFNADSGNNYAIRSATNGAADATTANTDSISAVTITANQGYYYTWNCNNPASNKEKYCNGFRTTSANGAGNVPARVEFASKWANLTSNITSVDLVRTASTGTLTAGSYIVVFGVS